MSEDVLICIFWKRYRFPNYLARHRRVVFVGNTQLFVAANIKYERSTETTQIYILTRHRRAKCCLPSRYILQEGRH